jgi:hypothetical protein
MPGKIDLSVVFGVALPIGAIAIAGRGTQLISSFRGRASFTMAGA